LSARTEASKLLDRNQKNASWSLRTIVPGDWRILTASEMAGALQHLLAIDKNVAADQVHGIRKMLLDFYDDAAVYEAEVKLPDGDDGIISYVQRGTDWVLLTGNRDAILIGLNKTAAPKLDQPDLALAYLRFYVNSIDVPDVGRLRMIDHAEDVDWFASASGAVRTSVVGKFKPLLLESTSDKEWQAIGTLQIGNTFWEASLHLARNGDVNMQQSRQIDKDWPVFIDTFVDGTRVQRTTAQMDADKPKNDLTKTQATLKANPKDEDALKHLPPLYFGMKRYKDAVDAEKNWVAYLAEQPDAVPTKTATLRDAYDLLAWYQFFSRDFAGALASSDAATKLDPKELTGEEEHALALLLLGRTKEAETILLANGGEKMGPSSTAIWEDSVFGDYNALKKEGISSPDAQRIWNVMTARKDRRDTATYEQQLKENSSDEKALRQLPYLYSKAKRWPDAVEGEKRLVAFLKTKPDTDATKNGGIVDALDVLSWYQLFARDFMGSLASADDARKLNPDQLFTESQRAHALMFLGRNQEAETIYVGNIGRKMNGSDNQTWEASILADFTALENEGLTNRELTRMRGLLQRPEYERLLGEYLQTLKINPNDEAALHYLPGVFYDLKRYREAADAGKNRIAHLLRENKHDADSTQVLNSAYGSLSWYQLLAGDFAGALASADEALKLASGDLVAIMNRAHALLFLGREKEAEAIYVANIGKKMDSDQPWDEGVLDDLTSLETAGFTNGEVARIRTLMRKAGYERLLARYTEELKANPNNDNALSRIGDVYLRLDRAKDAVDAQKNYIVWLQRQTNHDAAWTDSLAGADIGLAWFELFTRDFAGSLAASDEALKLNPKDLAAQTNRAHSLLFLGRTKDADAIYLGHRGEKVFANSDEKWEDAILTDFNDLEAGGLTNPEFARIRAQLKASAK
jgi:tetratricopeptide (TPR) repeat protein